MKKRIFGIETEFGVEILDEDGRVFSGQESKSIKKAELITQMEIRQKSSTGTRDLIDNFQINGGRIYKNTGNHIEHATPECKSVRDLLIYDKAGERIVCKIISKKRKQHNIKERLIIYKNNTDSVETIDGGSSWGCHENYLIYNIYFRNNAGDKLRKETLLRLIIPFLITRQIYSGAGWFFLSPRPFYVLSQRAPFVGPIEKNLVPPGQIFRQHKQMIGEKSAFAERKFKRLEIRVGESNLAEWSTYLKIGTTAIVLRMIEDNFLEKHLPLEHYNPIYALTSLKEIAKDITCKKPNVCLNGRYLNPIDVQRHLYLEPAKLYLARHGASKEEKDIIEKWEYVLNALDDNPLKLSDRLDVWIRLRLFLDYMKKHKISWNHWRIGALNLSYGDIDKKRSVFYRLQDKKKIKRIITDKEIRFAENNSPNNTRARLRSLMIKLAKENHWDYNVDWDKFIKTLVASHNRTRICFVLKWLDPFQSQDELTDKLIKKHRKRR